MKKTLLCSWGGTWHPLLRFHSGRENLNWIIRAYRVPFSSCPPGSQPLPWSCDAILANVTMRG
jgi:hypothetical protein